MAILWFILILGGIVLVHEFGHFIFSKLFGVYVYEFSIGMGPKLLHHKKKGGETEYCVRRIQGCAQLDEVSEVLNVEFSEIFDTFSGFVWDAIGRVPAEGEKFSIEANGLKIDVENIKNHMVDYAIVRKIPRKKIEKEPEE